MCKTRVTTCFAESLRVLFRIKQDPRSYEFLAAARTSAIGRSLNNCYRDRVCVRKKKTESVNTLECWRLLGARALARCYFQ